MDIYASESHNNRHNLGYLFPWWCLEKLLLRMTIFFYSTGMSLGEVEGSDTKPK